MKRSPLFFCLVLLFLLVVAAIPAAASPSISSVSPGTGPNDGDIEVTITGFDFNNPSKVWITPANYCDPLNNVTGRSCSWSPTSITCTFPIRGKPIGPYTLWVRSTFTASNGDLLPFETARNSAFFIYQGTGKTYTTTTTTSVTETVTTATTSGEGENSVFFETNPPGATIFLNGDEVGMSTFTYYTNKEGIFSVVARKIGYEDYQAQVTILEGKRVHFYAPLTQLASGSTAVTTPVSGTPAKTVTTIQKSTLKIPTPLGTFAPAAEESPADPAIALGAACIAIGLVLLRRR